MNVTDILVESPNGYRIITDAPEAVDDAIRYYLTIMNQYTLDDYPVEYGIVNYGMAKVLFGDTTKPKVSEERAKRIENSLYHFHLAMQVFNHSDYPILCSVISIMMATLFRERAALISNRSFLADRSSPEDSINYGVDQILEAIPALFKSKAHVIEHALCSLEAGWLFVLQSEFIDNFRDDSLREQAAMYLERTISLVQSVVQKGEHTTYAMAGEKSKRWNPITTPPAEYPEHVRLLLEGHPFCGYVEGAAMYLLGRLYAAWVDLPLGPEPTHETEKNKAAREAEEHRAASAFELQNQEKAFDYYSKCVRPKYLPKDCFLWADAHHRTAMLLIKYPKVVNPEYIEHDVDPNASDIHLEVALTHLNLALRCKKLSNPAAMDLHFHLAQTAISRLQIIIDRIPMGTSVTKALMTHSEGMDLITTVEEHLEEARKRVTPASTQTTQDAYLYYFSCLKISEFRMLEAACLPSLKPIERENFLTDAVEHLIDALNARSMNDNTDLHYVASVQMSQLLLAVKRSFAAAKSYAKCLFTLSIIINRSLYNPEDVQAKLSEETVRQVGQSLAAGAKDVHWTKVHYGPVRLNEKMTAGYASWSFEEAPNVKVTDHSSSALLDFFGVGDNSSEDVYKTKNKTVGKYGVPEGSGGSVATSTVVPIYKASPPKGVPPLRLPVTDNKKVFVSGDTMGDIKGKDKDEELDEAALALKKKKPPAGVIPLFSMGHNPDYDPTKLQIGEINYYLGPYGTIICFLCDFCAYMYFGNICLISVVHLFLIFV
jgi:exonuclease VII small subunit